MGILSVVKSSIGVIVVSYDLTLKRVARARALVIILVNLAAFVVVVVASGGVIGGRQASATITS